jgi:sulfur transfer complex TusBCD TusB component (DsrH family)
MTVISKVKQTLATLKGSEATLKMYSLQERDEEARAIYAEASEEISKIKIDLEKRVGLMEFQEPQYKGN